MSGRYLVDTNVISASAPERARHPGLLGWMDAHSERLLISTVNVAEVADGVAKLRREGSVRKAAALAEWLDTVLHLYADRILPLDIETALEVGPMLDLARRQGLSPGFADAAIAGTARRHGLTVLTRNIRDFAPFGVEALDPFDRLPA